MIHNALQSVFEDAKVLSQWMKGEVITVAKKEDQKHRVQVAAARMLAFIGISFCLLWSLQAITFIVTLPIKITFKLAFAVSFYVAAHDIFIMSQNSSDPAFRQTVQKNFWNLFRKHEEIEEDQARKFTQGTLVQPVWMWLYRKKMQQP